MKSKFSNFFFVIYNPTQLLKLFMFCFDKGNTGVGEAALSQNEPFTQLPGKGVQHLSGGQCTF